MGENRSCKEFSAIDKSLERTNCALCRKYDVDHCLWIKEGATSERTASMQMLQTPNISRYRTL